jgi:hypothetical protein
VKDAARPVRVQTLLLHHNQIINKFAHQYEQFSISISAEKTVLMQARAESDQVEA